MLGRDSLEQILNYYPEMTMQGSDGKEEDRICQPVFHHVQRIPRQAIHGERKVGEHVIASTTEILIIFQIALVPFLNWPLIHEYLCEMICLPPTNRGNISDIAIKVSKPICVKYYRTMLNFKAHIKASPTVHSMYVLCMYIFFFFFSFPVDFSYMDEYFCFIQPISLS